MTSNRRALVAPIYLFACLLLGGSAQDVWGNMLLQVGGLAIIGWAAIDKVNCAISPAAKYLFLIIIFGIALVALQLVPLPPAVWMRLGPRAHIAQGFNVLGFAEPWEPLSLTPASTLSSLFAVIPSLAMLSAVVRLKANRPQWIVIALIAGTMAGIALGALQVTAADPLQSPLYLYQDTNWGRAVGFFANADHMATLLIVTIPFLAALVAASRSSAVQHYTAIVAVAGGVGLVVLVGLGLNGSLAGYALALPVIAASAVLILPPGGRVRLWIIIPSVLLLIAAGIALESTAIGSRQVGGHAHNAAQSRADLLSTTLRAAKDFMPVGSGFGSFANVYPLYENPQQVTETYVVHAHNDYVELALELGLCGILLMLLFLTWWTMAVVRAWRTAELLPFARAASIASAAMLLHSAVDFPLRTAAISACFGLCMAFLVDRPTRQAEAGDLRPARYVTI